MIFFFQCSDFKNYSPVVEFDGANGVGALKMKDAIVYLDCTLVVNMHNDNTSNTEKLNLNVWLNLMNCFFLNIYIYLYFSVVQILSKQTSVLPLECLSNHILNMYPSTEMQIG